MRQVRLGSYSMVATLADIAVVDSLEVDDAILALDAAALVARRDATLSVASGLLRLRDNEGALWLGGRDLREVRNGLEPAAGGGWLALAKCHLSLSSRTTGSRCPAPA